MYESEYVSMTEYVDEVISSMTEEELEQLEVQRQEYEKFSQKFSEEEQTRMCLINHVCQQIRHFEEHKNSELFTYMTVTLLKKLFEDNLFIKHDKNYVMNMTREEVDKSNHQKSFFIEEKLI